MLATGTCAPVMGLVSRVVNRLSYFKCLVGMALYPDAIQPQFRTPPAGLVLRFLGRVECLDLAKNPDNGFDPDFVRAAYAQRDACLGILDGPVLASTGWYTSEPDVLNPGLELHFGNRFVYMYRGFTHPAYRGLRLHAHGIAQACEHFCAQGYEGLVSYVDAENRESLVSTKRLGFSVFGCVVVLRVRGQCVFLL